MTLHGWPPYIASTVAFETDPGLAQNWTAQGIDMTPTAVTDDSFDTDVLGASEPVLVVDYKTNRPPPECEDDVPDIYLKQMAAYGALLSQIYPDRAIECYLLWTVGPRLMQLSSDRLAGYAP